MTKRKARGATPPRGRESASERERVHEGLRAPYAFSLKLKVVQAIVDKGATQTVVSRSFGLSLTTVAEWVRLYRSGGADALRPQQRGREQSPSPTYRAQREAVVALREAEPELGTRRIRDLLARFDAIGVSETTVRRILHEAGLIEARPASGPREHPPRRFERAEPNQMWQSDIFTFLLRRHERLYLAAFMDDHSRFIVSFNLAHHQKSDLVMEALRRGIAAFDRTRPGLITDASDRTRPGLRQNPTWVDHGRLRRGGSRWRQNPTWVDHGRLRRDGSRWRCSSRRRRDPT